MAKSCHDAGLKCLDPFVAATQYIISVGDKTLSSFQKLILWDITVNDWIFGSEMYIVDNCDILVRTFNDSSIFDNLENKEDKNYSICNYSMHGSNNSFSKIPKELVTCNYESYDRDKKRTVVNSRPIIPRFINGITRELKSPYK